MAADKTVKPCPWCGAVPDVNNDATFRLSDGSKWGRINACGCPEVRTGYGPISEWKDAAIAAWNDMTANGGSQQ